MSTTSTFFKPLSPPLSYHPVIHLPPSIQVRDFTLQEDPLVVDFCVGRYNEVRPYMYTADLFKGVRCVHMGIDLGAPIGTPIHSFDRGIVYDFGYRSQEGDYGSTMIIEYQVNHQPLWALYGHLSRRSLQNRTKGEVIEKGQCFAWVGDQHENGGWPPHLHFQLSVNPPQDCDLPGVVTLEERKEALKLYPDPQRVLGQLYP